MEESLDPDPLFDRELSWLSFNYRVLQEAKDSRVPLVERLKFLAIYSSNLDEFYRVRVASVRSLTDLKKKTRKKLAFAPRKLLAEINRRVDLQQQEFGQIFREQILPGLREHNVHIVTDQEVSMDHRLFIRSYFNNKVLEVLRYDIIEDLQEVPFLENKKIYLIVRLEETGQESAQHVLIHLPTDKVSRFLVLPDEESHRVMLLDDVVRMSLDILFPNRTVAYCHSVKLSRDADLNIEDEFDGDLVDKIRKALGKRLMGPPSRFLYDEKMPREHLDYLIRVFKLEEEDLIPGGRYHNFMDYFGFPAPDNPELVYAKQPLLKHAELDRFPSFFDAIRDRDQVLHFPYQDYDYVVRFIEEAAEDPQVTSIKITLYRVASDSKVAKALIKAARNGKSVDVFDEIKARFDEQSNLFWGSELAQAGARVRYSYPDLKVHSKICLVKRKEEDKNRYYAYLGTGNFNEKTARIYGDHALLTCDKELCKDIDRVFEFLMDFKLAPKFKALLVAPFQMRDRFEEMIDREIALAQEGKKGAIFAKMNSLEDEKMVAKLYEASRAGVSIRLVVRGICRLIPGVEGMSENIEVRSIVDRYLEHARVYIFNNDGQEEMYVASADWMKRNLSRRVEVGFPIKDKRARKEIQKILDMQWDDNSKSRIINEEQDNPYVEYVEGAPKVEAQADTYRWLEERQQEPAAKP